MITIFCEYKAGSRKEFHDTVVSLDDLSTIEELADDLNIDAAELATKALKLSSEEREAVAIRTDYLWLYPVVVCEGDKIVSVNNRDVTTYFYTVGPSEAGTDIERDWLKKNELDIDYYDVYTVNEDGDLEELVDSYYDAAKAVEHAKKINGGVMRSNATDPSNETAVSAHAPEVIR